MQVHAIVFQHALDTLDLQADNLFDFCLVEWQEHDGLVDAVQELRSDGLLQHVHHFVLGFFHQQVVVIVRQLLKLALDVRTAQVGCHDDDGVLEVHRTSLVVGQSSAVQYLKQDIEYIRMRLFDFVQQDDGVGLATHLFGEQSTFFITHISRRSSHEARNGMALLVLRHIDTGHHAVIVEEEFGQRLRQLRLTDGTSIAIGNLSDSRAEESFNSFFATFAYDFDGKYFLDASYRADGSSKFAPGHRWGHFYSVGGMWDLKKENFLKDVDWLDVLQARATYGLVGNSTGAGSYDYYGLFGTGSMYNGQSSMGISNPSNSTLTWEKVGSFNAGVSFGFLDRVVLNVDAYRRKTTDMLMSIPFSYTTGFGGGMGNIGAMVNKGFDADVNVKILKGNDFDWSLKANVNYNKNEITELFAGRDEYIIANTGLKLEVGKPYGEFYYVEYAGVDPRDGKPMWYDKDGNLTKVYNEERDSKFTGKQRYAPWSGGFGTSFSWKGLSITADFAWQAGKYMINNDNYFLKNANQGTSFNQSVDMLNIWTKPGDITDIPKYGEQVQFDTHLLEDASFLRMKNLIVQYSFPEKWMKATKGIQNAKVFFVGRNLFTATKFSGYDPEPDINLVKFNYPNTRQFVFGMELTF